MGDFYETFDGDAELVAGVLGIALTSRPMGRAEGRVPLAGIPWHQLERHLERLVAAGHRVAICEQTSEPGNGLVERRIVRVVTPGTVDAGALLEGGGNNWLVAVGPGGTGAQATGEPRYGVAACDVTTGELECRVATEAELAAEWARLRPREALLAEGVDGALAPPGALVLRRPARGFEPARAVRELEARYAVATLDGFGLDGLEAGVGATGALVDYVAETWPAALPHLRPPRGVRGGEFVELDAQTRRNLDLFEGARASGGGSLLETLDRTLTPMGARLLRERIGRPLRRLPEIEARLDQLETLAGAPLARAALRRALRGLPDLERLLGRVRAGTATARQLVTLRHGLERLPVAAAAVVDTGEALTVEAAALGAAREAAEAIALALADEPPADVSEGGTVRAGFDAEIDALRTLAGDAREALAALEAEARAHSGIAAVKVGYHRVFGYYLELPRSQAERAPAEWEPRQTLAAAVRYRNAALAGLEARILAAKDELETAERAVLARVRQQVAEAGPGIERAAAAVARLDVAAALAEVAAEGGPVSGGAPSGRWVRPVLAEQGPIVLEGARHPVVERRLERGEFVPNDVALGEGADVVIVTGPNMGGKSTYLRQAALCVLLAQAGSFVPAAAARIGLVDRIFARVGAQDDIAAGQSTFMVEMVETAAILHQATERSLVILDEVGRGTSTWDGLAIARAVVEHLHHRPAGTPRTLFATHYHELTALAQTLPRVANRSVAVAEQGGEVVFLHRIVEGGADRSYGVHVAALAGLPRAVVDRARELLHQLEAERPAQRGDAAGQLSLLGALRVEPLNASTTLPPVAGPDPLLGELAALEPDALSPLEALQRLYELRREARDRLALEG